jgi:hypothetical protein
MVVILSSSNYFKNKKVLHLYCLLTYSVTQSPSWKTNRFSASQQIPLILWIPKVITAFASARHLFLSWASSIQSIGPHPTSYGSIVILSFHLRPGLPSGLLPSGFPCKRLSSPPIRAKNPVNLILPGFISHKYISLYNFMESSVACVRVLKLNWIKSKCFLELKY